MKKTLNVFSLATLATTFILATAAIAQEAPTPITTLGLTSVVKVLDSVGAVSSQLNPEMDAATLKTMAGAYLGDPTLSGFGENDGIVAYVINEKTFAVFAEISKDKAQDYLKTFKKQKLNADIIDDMLVISIAQDKKDIDSVKTFAPLAKAYLSQEKAPSLELSLNVAKIMDKFGPTINEAIKGFGATAKNADESKEAGESEKIATKLIWGGSMFINNLAKQLNTIDFGVAFAPEKFDISYSIEAKADTPLAKTMTVSTDLNPDLLKFVPVDNETVGYSISTFNADKASVDFISSELLAVTKTMGLNYETAIENVRGFFARVDESFGTNMAISYKLSSTAGNNDSYIVVDLKDKAKAQEMITQVCTATNEFFKNQLVHLTSSTLTIDYKKDAGQVGDVAYDQLVFTSKGSTTDSISLMSFVMTDNKLMAVTNDAKIEKLIELSKTPAETIPPLPSKDKITAGAKPAQMGVLRSANFLNQFMVSLPVDKESTETAALVENISKRLQGMPDCSYYVATKDTSAFGSFEIPSKLIVEIAKIASELQEKVQTEKASGEMVDIDVETTDTESADTTVTEVKKTEDK